MILVTISLSIGCVPVRAQDRDNADMIKLFRDEAAHAPQRLKWRGRELEDETRFAVAASGLTWSPMIGDNSLLVSDKKGIHYADLAVRVKGFHNAKSQDEEREKFAFAISLVLTATDSGDTVTKEALSYLKRHGEAYDRVLLGIIQSPDRLPLLSEYLYSAADLLVHRTSMRLFPIYLTLADSKDSYLKSRGIVALGILGYRTSAGRPDDYVVNVELRENGISAVQRRLISQLLERASDDRSFHVRAAAAFAYGLIGESDSLTGLEQLAKDRAYVVTSAPDKQTKTILFPVRHEAVIALRRLGRSVAEGSGTFHGKELNNVLRGTQDITVDNSEIRRGLPFGLPINVNHW